MDTFALIINYFNDSSTPMHATIGLFEFHETMRLSMVKKSHTSLEKYDLMHLVITSMKYSGSNLMSIVIALCSIIDIHLLKL